MAFQISIDTGSPTQLEKIGGNLITAGEDIITGLSVRLTNLGQDISDSLNPEYYLEVANTVAGDALDYVNKLKDQLIKATTTMTTVTVGSLMGEVAPFAKDFGSAGELLGQRVDDLIADIEKTVKTELEGIDYYLADVAKHLAPLKVYADVEDGIKFVKKSAQDIVTIVEPLIPLFKEASDTSLVIASGGASAASATVTAAQIREWKTQFLINLLIEKLKNILYAIRIPVPQIVAGTLKRLSIKQAVMDFGNQWLNSIFSTQFFDETIANTYWMQGINEELYHIQNDILNPEKNRLADILGIQGFIDSNRYSKIFFQNVLANTTRIVLDEILEDVRKNVELITFNHNVSGTQVSTYVKSIETTNISSKKTVNSLIVMDTQKKLLGSTTNEISEENIRLLSGQILGCI